MNATNVPSGASTGQLEVTTNAGGLWTDTAANGLPTRYVADIAVNPALASEAYISLSGFAILSQEFGSPFKTLGVGQRVTRHLNQSASQQKMVIGSRDGPLEVSLSQS